MAAGGGLAMNLAQPSEERAVFTQLRPVRMSGAGGAEDASVFEDVKPGVRIITVPLTSHALPSNAKATHEASLCEHVYDLCLALRLLPLV